jgi:mono/diheme cytochrome c family protein
MLARHAIMLHSLFGRRSGEGKIVAQSLFERRGMMLNHVIVIATLAVLFAAPHVVSAQNTQVDHGMKVFADQKCAVCHSIAGKGNQKGALDDVGATLTADELRAWIVTPAEMTKKAKAERKPPMRAYPNLPKEDLDALVGYLASLKKK